MAGTTAVEVMVVTAEATAEVTVEATDGDTLSCLTVPPEVMGEPTIVPITTLLPRTTAGMVNMAAGTDTMTTSLTVTAGSDILNKVTHLELCLFRNGRLTLSLFVYSCPT